ncbi:hypothetical protein LCGC14_2040570, partial [marine sediment metagenome]
PIGIHESMDMTIPGLISQQSILKGGAWLDVPDSRSWLEPPRLPQLQMIWPERRLDSPPEPVVPSGYSLRCYDDSDSDADGWLAVMAKAGFDGWDRSQLAGTLKTVLPGGFHLIVHQGSGAIVAVTMAQHCPMDGHPYGGIVGWVAGDPDHKGKGIGLAVVGAATARLIRGGYTDIYLQTDDWRLPAIKVYLKLGFEPLMYLDDMPQRWQAVRDKLGV